MSGETFKVGATDLGTNAYITSWEGILASPTYTGDLIELDFVTGGVWQAGVAGVWTIDVPLVMKSQDPNTAVSQMVAIQSLADGTEKDLRREFTSGTTSIKEANTGVVTSATPTWDLRFRNRVGLLLTIQVTGGLWATTT